MKARRLSCGFYLALVAWLALAMAWMPADGAENPATDKELSTRLTNFLKNNRLPLVSAQVLKYSGGSRSVMLSGYTATETGKTNAEKRTRLFLKDSNVPITNRIKVRPELASMKSPSAPSQAGAPVPQPDQLGDIRSYETQQYDAARQRYIDQQVRQYANQQNTPSSLENALIPLIALGLAIGLGATGKGIPVSPGFGQPYPYYGPAYRYNYQYGPNPRCYP